MDPTTMILTALVTGLSAGLGEAAEKAVVELFNAFKARLHRLVSGKPDAENAMQAVESKPDSEARQAVLKEELEALEVQKDRELVEMAQAVLKQADPDGAQSGKYNVSIYGGQGITVGDHAKVTQTFHNPASRPKSGK